jgi:dolichol-phosphate mannosyltransferase
MDKLPLLSIIIPAHNEVESIPLLYATLNSALATLPYRFEFIFVDDGSRDNTAELIKSLAAKDSRIRLLEFARNFGKEAAISAGLHASRGDAAIMMDADLQHPPEIIPKFIAKWEAGSEVVVGVRKTDGKDNWIKAQGSKWFYRIMQWISHTHITPHATDYRLLDRCVIEEFNRLTEHNRMNRGLIDWLGFRREYVKFEAATRKHGQASYTMGKLIGLAISSFTSYSMMPLRLAGYLGIFILTLSAPVGMFVFFEQYIYGDPLQLNVTGSASLGLVVLFLVGLVLVCLGLVALYIAHIHDEVIARPLYVVRKEKQWQHIEEAS